MTGVDDWLLRAEDIAWDFGGPFPLRAGVLEVGPGEFLGIVGPSGSGKSALVRLLLRLDVPLLPHPPGTRPNVPAGCLHVRDWDGQPVDLLAASGRHVESARGTLVAGVLQKDGLVPEWTALDNALAARSARGAGPSRMEEVRRMLVAMGVAPDTPAAALSGGERKRVALARAMCTGARVLVLDEAFAGLDGGSTATVLEIVAQWAGVQRAVLAVTHRSQVVARAQRIVAVVDGDVRGPYPAGASEVQAWVRVEQEGGTR